MVSEGRVTCQPRPGLQQRRNIDDIDDTRARSQDLVCKGCCNTHAACCFTLSSMHHCHDPLQLIYQTLFGTIIVNMPPMHTIIHVIACALSFG